MWENGLLETLIKVIKSGNKRTPQGSLPAVVQSMPEGLATYCEALLHHEPPMLLSMNHWELGLLNEESARELVQRAGGHPELGKHAHIVGVGMETGGLAAVVGFTPGDHANDVYVCDEEYHTVKHDAFSFRVWIQKRFSEGARGELHRAIEELMGPPVPTREFVFEKLGRDAWAAVDKLEDEATDKLLRAGQHMYFCSSESGDMTVAIHHKGVRFVGTNGKRKSKNVKGFKVDAGAISEDGSYVLLLNSYKEEASPGVSFHRFTRVSLPDGRMTEIEAKEGFWSSFAYLREHHILKAQEGEVILHEVTDDGVEPKQHLGSVDILATFPQVFSFHHGRLFFVQSGNEYFVGAFKGGGIRWIGKGSAKQMSDIRVHDGRLHVQFSYVPHVLTGYEELYERV